MALGNAYPAELLDASGKVTDRDVFLQFTDSTNQPGAASGGTMAALGNSYPAELLDAHGRPVNSAATIQFTNSANQPGSGGSTAKTYTQVVLEDSPVFLFLGNDTSGNLVDSSGNGYVATAHGASILYAQDTGRAGLPKGFHLPGSSAGYFTVANAAPLNPTSTLSYECWFSFASNPGGTQLIMTKGATSTNFSFGTYVDSSGDIGVSYVGSGNIASGGHITTNTLHHIVLTYTGTTYTIYVDSFATYLSGTHSGPSSTSEPFGIGTQVQDGTPNFQVAGILAGVALYSTALTATQVTNHYVAGVGPAT